MRIDQITEKWSQKYKRSIDCSNPKGFSQKAHCAGRKKKNESIPSPDQMGKPTLPSLQNTIQDLNDLIKDLDKGKPQPKEIILDPEDYREKRKEFKKQGKPYMITKVKEGKRIPRKKGQPAGSKKHSDLYTDENPKGTIHGLKFATVADAKASVSKIRNSGKSHAHKIQAAVAMEQRAKAAGKTTAAGVYRTYINAMKKKTKKKNESIYENNANDKVMELLLDNIGAGPFDGGCVIVAQALQMIHGGEIMALVRPDGIADHAVVQKGNTMYDFDGPGTPQEVISRFEKNEGARITDVRKLRMTDLTDAPRNTKLAKQIATIMQEINVTESKEIRTQRRKDGFTIDLYVDNKHVGQYTHTRDDDIVRNFAEIFPEYRNKGYGTMLLLAAIKTADDMGMDFEEDTQSLTPAMSRLYDELSDSGLIYGGGGAWTISPSGESELEDFLNESAKVNEGVNDPHIFKAVFMAGGPGSGKSFVAQNLLGGTGLRTVNSDEVYEFLMKRQGLSLDPDVIASPQGQDIRTSAKDLTTKRQENYVDGRLGLIIDGTGKNPSVIQELVQKLKSIGYSVSMIFVNTSLEVAQQRNAQRDRVLPAKLVADSWNEVQQNLMKYQQIFGADRFHIIDNSGGLEDLDRQKNFDKVYNELQRFINTPPKHKKALEWIQNQKAQNNAKPTTNSGKSDGGVTSTN